jgi:hypothetical protein
MMGKKIKCLNPLFHYSIIPVFKRFFARRDRLAALGAGLGRTELEGAHVGMAGLIENPAAATAFQESLSPLDGNQGNEEKTDVMVQSFKPGRG